MKNKPTIKTPIPAASPLPIFAFACISLPRVCCCLHPLHLGIRLPHSVCCLLYSAFYPYLLSSPVYRLCSCPFVASWLQVNYAKQSQFHQPQNRRNRLSQKGLQQYPTAPDQKKQTQTNPIPPPTGRHTLAPLGFVPLGTADIPNTKHDIRHTKPVRSLLYVQPNSIRSRRYS